MLAGVEVLPGRDCTPLLPTWEALVDRIPDDPARRALSRFLRFASSAGWEPEEIGPGHLERFRHVLQEKALRSKADKVTRLFGGDDRAPLHHWPVSAADNQGDEHYKRNVVAKQVECISAIILAYARHQVTIVSFTTRTGPMS